MNTAEELTAAHAEACRAVRALSDALTLRRLRPGALAQAIADLRSARQRLQSVEFHLTNRSPAQRQGQ